ncbi:MAG TPA: SIMPL domain-containing protein [Roseiflexaceae bacterium]|nr:SIMPL domain-containing protein [Roseiflexaceae bacterium]
MIRRAFLLPCAGILLLVIGIAIGIAGTGRAPAAVAQTTSTTPTPATAAGQVSLAQFTALQQQVAAVRQDVAALQQENADVSQEIARLVEQTTNLVQVTSDISTQTVELVRATDGISEQTALVADGIRMRTITAIGFVELKGEPDLAIARIDVKDEAPGLAQALPANQARVAATIGRIVALGITPDKIQTTDPDVAPVLGDDRKISGYRVLTPVLVTIADPKGAGAAQLAQVIAIGGNSFKEIQFKTSDPSSAEQQAREAAFRQAEARAQGYARLAGLTLGDIQHISEDLNVRRLLPQPALPGQPKEQLVTAEEQITYRIVEP